MKVFLVLCLASLAAAGGGEDWQIYKQWMMMKAQESCWGEENSKLHTVMLKKAVAKCHQVDAPELNLPPFRAPYRFINTMLTSSSNMEKQQVMAALMMIKMMKKHHGFNSHHDEESYEARPYMKREKKPWLEKMMEKIVMEKMYNNKHHSQYESSNYDSDMDFSDMDFSDMMSKFMNKKQESGYESKYGNSYGSNYDSSEKYSLDKVMERMMKEQVQESMMQYKMKANNPFSGDQSSYREKMTALLRRHKRAAGEDSAVNLPGSLDLGDRLAEKIEEEQKNMEAKVGNMTCVLREMGVLNADNEIDFESEKRTLEKFDFPDQWFKNRIIDGMEDCNKMVEAIPSDVTDELNYPGLPEVFRIKSYMKCCKKTMLKNCMYKDVKEKLENNFGDLETILEQTQLNEEQLFPLVIKLLHGEEMEYM